MEYLEHASEVRFSGLQTCDDSDSDEIVDEDAELELSCALQDLTTQIKTFEVNMQHRFLQSADEMEDEIDEDIPEEKDAVGTKENNEEKEKWDEESETKELTALQKSIRQLLYGIKKEAKALDQDNQ